MSLKEIEHIEGTHTVSLALEANLVEFGNHLVFSPVHILGELEELVDVLPRGAQALPLVDRIVVLAPCTGGNLAVRVVHVV